MNANQYLTELMERYPVLDTQRDAVWEAFAMIRDSYEAGGRLLMAGNGGSAADTEHMAGELMKSFVLPRPIAPALRDRLIATDESRGSYLSGKLEAPLPAISLVTHEALSTAYINDADVSAVYAQQLLGHGKKGDVFLGISTSGNSENVLNAAVLAKAMDIKVIGLTGAGGGALKQLSDVAICVPESETYRIQELHLPVYHCLCMMLEAHFFGQA